MPFVVLCGIYKLSTLFPHNPGRLRVGGLRAGMICGAHCCKQPAVSSCQSCRGCISLLWPSPHCFPAVNFNDFKDPEDVLPLTHEAVGIPRRIAEETVARMKVGRVYGSACLQNWEVCWEFWCACALHASGGLALGLERSFDEASLPTLFHLCLPLPCSRLRATTRGSSACPPRCRS